MKEGFTAVNAYWGNQFIVFLDQEIDCIDMWWVQTFNLQGEEPPTSRDLRTLQITYNNEDEEVLIKAIIETRLVV